MMDAETRDRFSRAARAAVLWFIDKVGIDTIAKLDIARPTRH
jgi:hypothetical protein